MAYWKSLLAEKVINDRVVVKNTFARRRDIRRKWESFESLRVAEYRLESLQLHETSSTKLSRVISSNVDFLGLHYHHLPLPTCVSSRFPYHFQYPPACVILSRAKPTLKTRKMLENLQIIHTSNIRKLPSASCSLFILFWM